MTTRILTGITTTGTPHLGNYVGAIRPAIAASLAKDVDSFFFLADYHALIKCDDPARIARSRLEIAATWLACGLDPARVTFYRQSDIPEIPELTWLLTCVTAKGLLNRAHAYKAAVEQNAARGEDPDAAITAGLYMYPVLMAADILIFNANRIPVGRDQVQHIEMARDVAQRFNHLYGGAWRRAGGRGEPFALPEAAIDEDVATLPGLDGRKMSKSYDNTVPLFEGGAKALRAAVARIVTDSRAPGEPKDPDSTSLYAIFRAFAGDAESAAFRAELEAGMGWGDAKQKLCARIEQDLAPLRERYDALMARPDDIEDTLLEGARKARALAAPRVEIMRRAVGLGALLGARSNPPPRAGDGNARSTHAGGGAERAARASGAAEHAARAGSGPRRVPIDSLPPLAEEAAEHPARAGSGTLGTPNDSLPPPAGEGGRRPDGGRAPSAAARTAEGSKRARRHARIVSFREAGAFHFRLLGADGEELLLSRAFTDPHGAGQASRVLSTPAAAATLATVDDSSFAVFAGDAVLASSARFADAEARDAALARTRAALASLREAED